MIYDSIYDLVSAISYTAFCKLLRMPARVVAATRIQTAKESEPKTADKDLIERKARLIEIGATGLPVSIRLVARHWCENIVLAVMGALEQHFKKQLGYLTCPPL
ncbi:hypothetical protein [Nostoc sp. WHI]|uniref:hypothetical protein n=1 Tax=Nostoc sp. WHI TaxID=2650611 RepID=UPI0018C46839|nr:hypothetical protein [Nostoc sp. WHI]MBG1271047.1 hypothetical protein [Nostoc sp. WHI]